MDLLLDVLRGHVGGFVGLPKKAKGSAKGKGGGAASVAITQTMVFCNTVASCRAVEHRLRDAGLNCGAYHGEMGSDDRTASLTAFKRGGVATLVCTDLAQRGLDLPGVGHVVMFDFPLNAVDYLHRAGRTARFGEPGAVTSLVAKRDATLARALEQAVARGEPLDQLSNDRRDYLPGGRLAAQSPLGKRAMNAAAGRIAKSRGLGAWAPGKGGKGTGIKGGGKGRGKSGRGGSSMVTSMVLKGSHHGRLTSRSASPNRRGAGRDAAPPRGAPPGTVRGSGPGSDGRRGSPSSPATRGSARSAAWSTDEPRAEARRRAGLRTK